MRCEGKIFLLTNAKARAKHSFSALKYLKPISLRHREVRKAPGIAICTKKVKNIKWSSNENYGFYSGRHLFLFHWRARFRNLGTRKMSNQSDKSLLCSRCGFPQRDSVSKINMVEERGRYVQRSFLRAKQEW